MYKKTVMPMATATNEARIATVTARKPTS